MKTFICSMSKFFLAITVMFLVACNPPKPDLKVTNRDMQIVSWTETSKITRAVIRNVGNATATDFRVYFDYRESPVSSNYLPQNAFGPFTLAAGDSLFLSANVQVLARPENNYLRNIKTFIVTADPKNMVDESIEYNNRDSLPVPRL